jgi:hypothetical protein
MVASLVAAFALVAIASLAGAAAPAQAYYLKNTDFGDFHSFLRFPPKHPSFRPCISNTVTLRPGHYVHGAYIVSQSHRTNPDLENADAGLHVRVKTTYNWEVCRGWNDEIRSGVYQVRSTLLRRGFKDSALMISKTNWAADPSCTVPVITSGAAGSRAPVPTAPSPRARPSSLLLRSMQHRSRGRPAGTTAYACEEQRRPSRGAIRHGHADGRTTRLLSSCRTRLRLKRQPGAVRGLIQR